MPPSDNGLPKAALLRKPAQFRAVYQQGKRKRGNHFSLITLANQGPFHRLGISVHGVKTAVRRNRTKRLIREFFRLNRQFLPGHKDIVFANFCPDTKTSSLPPGNRLPPPRSLRSKSWWSKPSGARCRCTMKQLCMALIRLYQLLISPLFPPSCRFHPTCSCYAMDAFSRHGFSKGLYLSLRRLLRCHPFCQGGYDPVPPADQQPSLSASLTPLTKTGAEVIRPTAALDGQQTR